MPQTDGQSHKLAADKQGKCVTTGDCNSEGVAGIDRDKPVTEAVRQCLDGPPDIFVSPDESVFVVRDDTATRSFFLSRLDQEYVFTEGEPLPAWLQNYDAWSKRQVLFGNNLIDGRSVVQLLKECGHLYRCTCSSDCVSTDSKDSSTLGLEQLIL